MRFSNHLPDQPGDWRNLADPYSPRNPYPVDRPNRALRNRDSVGGLQR